MIIPRISLQEREFSAHKRKQNRKVAAAQHNAEMHTNKAAKKVKEAQEALMKGEVEKAETLTKSAEKANRAAQIDANRAADEVTKIAKTRKSIVNNPDGLKISNQGAGEMVVKKQGDVVSVSKITNGGTVTTKVNKPAISVGNAGPSVKVDVRSPKVKVSTESIGKNIDNTKKMINAGKFIRDNKKALLVTAGITTAGTLGGVAYKKYKDNKKDKK